MSHDTNETKQHFKFRNLDQDMREAHAKAFEVKPKEYVRRLKAENLGILIALAVLAFVWCYVLGVF